MWLYSLIKGVYSMKNVVYNVLNDMSDYLNISQMKHIQESLIDRIVEKSEDECDQIDNLDYMELFLSAKKIEGCTARKINKRFLFNNC